ncbi:MAG: 2-C-methyl-D-erythritol 4-phosphate cytidylyltransferase [Oscillospiraceae bacterium]|nr:2-C-methyl-D-erythritol 4-phosphate cytidylyltransferase [Oscillospiraceae bacterium]
MLKSLSPKKPPTCSVVIAAAGSSLRCKGEDKLFYSINDRPVLAHTIEVFEHCVFIDEIVIVTQEKNLEKIAEMCREYRYKKVSRIMVGGATRAQSVFNGVFAVSKKAKLIAIHDGARACIDTDTIERTLAAAARYNAAAPAVEVVSTLKRLTGKVITETVDRNKLVEIQTPQIFRAEIIKAALTNAMKKSIEITDDCMAAEIIGVPVHTVLGSRKNIKITEIDDLQIATSILSQGVEA